MSLIGLIPKTTKTQPAGFKYGKYPLKVIRQLGEVKYNGRRYRLAEVETHDKDRYYSLRLYNERGHFIKQLLWEPEITGEILELIRKGSERNGN